MGELKLKLVDYHSVQRHKGYELRSGEAQFSATR